MGLCCVCHMRYMDKVRLEPERKAETWGEICAYLRDKEIIPEPFATVRLDRVLSEMEASGIEEAKRWLHLLTNANPLPGEESSTHTEGTL
jgi:hypothetical protein